MAAGRSRGFLDRENYDIRNISIMSKAGMLAPQGASGLALYPAALIPAVVLALLSWHAVEKPALGKMVKALWLIHSSQPASLLAR
jgi:peptidoglycan/LPS O-acetylase OafA/YrhL